MLNTRRAESARRTRPLQLVRLSFPAGSRSNQFFIPGRVKALCKVFGYVAINDRVQGAALRENAHVDVNQEEANGEQRGGGVDQNGGVAEPAETPRDIFGEPQDETAEEQ